MAAFSLQLHRRVESALVASGKFDGSHACLVAATSGGNVIVHSPHRRTFTQSVKDEGTGRLAEAGQLAELRIGKQVTALCTGQLGENDKGDVVLVGTSTHLLVYNVEDNADVFYKEMPDGVYAVVVGKVGWLKNSSVAIVGGSASVTILDASGTDVFWTVTGDVVASLALIDLDNDCTNELLVGSADFEVRALKGDMVLWETKETAAVIALVPLSTGVFAYAVGNGTVGVYEAGQRLWRVKSKHKVIAIRGFNITGTSTKELVTGWSSGKVDARVPSTGEVVFRVQLQAAIAGIVRADYRRKGTPDLVVVSATGEVRGYGVGVATEIAEPGDKVRDLLAKKQALISEMRHRAANPVHVGSRLAVGISCSSGSTRLALAAGPGFLIYCAIVFAEGVFEGETLVAHPSRPKGQIEIEMQPQKDVPVDVHVKVCVGSTDSDLLQVFEITRQLPRFCMYEKVAPPNEVPPALLDDSGVTAEISERPQRVAIWLGQNLILPDGVELEVSDNGSTEFWLHGLRDEKIHCIEANASGKLRVRTEDSSFAGDVIQSLAAYLGLGELASQTSFPSEEKQMSDTLERITGLREAELRLRASEASSALLLGNLLVRMEDARILGNATSAKARLARLKAVNGDLMREREIRANGHANLVKHLKDLNVAVQRVARHRVGKASANAVARCRAAIQDGDGRALVLAARHG